MIGLMNNTGRKTVKGEKTSAPKKATSKVSTTAAAKTAPTHDEIAKRSYELFLDRGGEHGHDAEDWARAEAELLGR